MLARARYSSKNNSAPLAQMGARMGHRIERRRRRRRRRTSGGPNYRHDVCCGRCRAARLWLELRTRERPNERTRTFVPRPTSTNPTFAQRTKRPTLRRPCQPWALLLLLPRTQCALTQPPERTRALSHERASRATNFAQVPRFICLSASKHAHRLTIGRARARLPLASLHLATCASALLPVEPNQRSVRTVWHR